MRFVFDECLSHRIPNALGIMGKDVCSSIDEWGAGVKDIDWIPVAGKRGWSVITSDRLKAHERLALRENTGRVFLLGARNLSAWEAFRLIVNKWDDIEKAAKKKRPPYIIRVPKRGKLQQVFL